MQPFHEDKKAQSYINGGLSVVMFDCQRVGLAADTSIVNGVDQPTSGVPPCGFVQRQHPVFPPLFGQSHMSHLQWSCITTAYLKSPMPRRIPILAGSYFILCMHVNVVSPPKFAS